MRRILYPVIRSDMEEYERAADKKEVLKLADRDAHNYYISYIDYDYYII